MTAPMLKPKALVTGAASGIGLALSNYLAGKGYDLYMVDVNADALNRQAAQLQMAYPGQHLHAYTCDLSCPEAITDLIEQIKSDTNYLNVLVNNAGITHRSLAMQTDIVVTQKVMQVDFLAPVQLTHGLHTLLVAGVPKFNATVINVGSMAGWMPVMARSSYCAAKSALHQYFETLRAEWQDDNIGLLMVYPSFLATEIERNALSGTGRRASHARSTVGRVQTVEWLVARIDEALEKGAQRLFADRFINLASVLYRLCPRWYLRMMRRRFVTELDYREKEPCQ